MPDPLTRDEIKDLNIARVRDALFDGVYQLWRKRKKQGLTQKDLATELGRDAAWVSRNLAGPRNWTVKTVAEMLMALDGKIEVEVTPREAQPQQNFDYYAAHIDGVTHLSCPLPAYTYCDSTKQMRVDPASMATNVISRSFTVPGR